MRSIVEDARDEIKAIAPKIRPPSPETIDSLRALSGPLARPQDPIVALYADQRAQQRAGGVQTLNANRDPLGLGALQPAPPPSIADRQRQAYAAPSRDPLGLRELREPESASDFSLRDRAPAAYRQLQEGSGPRIVRELARDIPDVIREPARRLVSETAQTYLAGGPIGRIGDEILRRTPGAERVAGPLADIRQKAGDLVAEVTVPRQVWEVALEAVPGIGVGPDAVRAGRRALATALADEGLPATVRGVRTLVERKTPAGVRQILTEEFGGIGGDRRRLQTAGENFLDAEKRARMGLPERRAPDEQGVMLSALRDRARPGLRGLGDKSTQVVASQTRRDMRLREAGNISPQIAARIGASAAGAAAGSTQGDTPQERFRNALIGAGLGAAGAELLIRNPGALDALVKSERGALDPDALKAHLRAKREAAGGVPGEPPDEVRAIVARAPSGEATAFDYGGIRVERIPTGPKKGRWRAQAGNTEVIGLSPESTISLVRERLPSSTTGPAARGEAPAPRPAAEPSLAPVETPLTPEQEAIARRLMPAEFISRNAPPMTQERMMRAIESAFSQRPDKGATAEELRPLMDALEGRSPNAGDAAPAFNPTPEELTQFRTLIDHGDWTTTPGARIAANTALKKLQAGEVPSDKQFALFYRALASKQPTAAPGRAAPKVAPKPGKPQSARAAPERLAEGAEPRGLTGERVELPPDTGAAQLALADNVADAYVGALSVGRGVDPAQVTSKFTNFLRQITSPLSLIKTIKTTADIGWGGRNGWRLIARNPREWARMYGRQYKALAGEAQFEEMQAAAKAYPWRARADASERPLAVLERGTGSPETSGEEFLSVGDNPVMRGVRTVLSPFERAYVAPGNLMRAEVFDKNHARLVRVNKGPVSDADFQLLEDIANNATLRGNTSALGLNSGLISSLLFSAKGVVSGPQFAADMIRALVNGGGQYSNEARKIAAEQVGAYVAMGMSVLGTVAATGYALDKADKPSFVNVDLNDLSPTFGQISVGNKRWNYWGSDATLVRTLVQMARRKTQKPGLPAQAADPFRLGQKFIANKLAPGLPRAAYDVVAEGGRSYNEGIFNTDPINMKSPMGALIYAFNQVSPIPLGNAVNSYREGGVDAALFSAATDPQGLTTSTYDLAPSEREIKSAENAPMRKKVDASGYNDIGGDIWKELQDDGSAPKEYATPGEMRDSIVAEVLAEIEKESPGADPLQAQAIADEVAGSVSVLDLYAELTTAARDSFLRANPEIATLLVQLGERSASETMENLAEATP